MGRESGYDSLLRDAASTLGTTLRRHTNRKACGPCPQCGGNDRFVVWLYEQYGWCSRCSYQAWLTDDPAEARKSAMQQKIEREQRIRELRDAMSVSVDWLPYNERAMRDPSLWLAEGMTMDDIRTWGLGIADQCPCFPSSRSLTMPVFFHQQLMDIRHRLLDADTSTEGKYRSHLPDLTPVPFNLDALTQHPRVVVVEGEKKAITMCRFGYTNCIGLPGINSAEMLVQELAKPDTKKPSQMIIAFDPGANQQAERLAHALFGVEVLVADCFSQPDDLLNRFGNPVMDSILRQARPARKQEEKRHAQGNNAR